jgi:hypothetical protein
MFSIMKGYVRGIEGLGLLFSIVEKILILFLRMWVFSKNLRGLVIFEGGMRFHLKLDLLR